MQHTEQKIQIACVRWFRLQYAPFASLLVNNRNTSNSAAEGAKHKAMGSVAGVADMVLYLPNKKNHLLFIEFKTETGRQSAEQKRWQKEVEDQGYLYHIVRSFDDFVLLVTNYMKNLI